MKSLLFLCLVGAAIYATLLLSNPLPDPDTSATATQAQNLAPKDVRLSSWGSDLGSLKPRIAAEKRPHPRYYERKPRRMSPTIDEEAVAESTAKAKPTLAAPPKPKAARVASSAPPKPKAARVASRKAKWRSEPARAERAVAEKSELKSNRWQRRAERRARNAFRNRAFLLGR